jgi:hypothetical protein
MVRAAVFLVILIALGLQLSFGSVSYAASAGPSSATGSKTNVVTFGTQTSGPTKPDGRGYYDYGAGAGGTIPDQIAVINYSSKEISLLIRPTDALNTPQGGFAALPITERSTGVGTWIALPKNDLSVTLPPRTDVIIPFRVEVPKSATPGDHVGVLTATLVSSIISKSGERVALDQTVGTRVFIRVSGPLHPAFAVENLKVKYRGTLNPIGKGKVVLTYAVKNIGNVALGGKQTVSVSGMFGSKAVAKKTAEVQLLLPGFSVKESVTVTGVIPEILDTGHVSVSPLYIPGSIQPKSGPFKANVQFWAVPWIIIAIVLFIILTAVWLLWRRRRRRKPAPPAVKPGKSPDGTTAVESGAKVPASVTDGEGRAPAEPREIVS